MKNIKNKFFQPKNFWFSLVCFITLSCSSDKANYSKEVTPENILAIEIRMTKDEVKKILGNPVEENPSTFTYTEKMSRNYPMLWIHFDNNNEVREVYAKYYDYLDDRGIYGLTRNKENDSIEQWGVEALEKYFK